MASSFCAPWIHEHMDAQGYMGWVREVVSEVAL